MVSLRAVLIANLQARRARRWLDRTLEACDEAQINIEAIHVRCSRERVQAAVERARRDDITTVLALGGDGTIGSVMGALVHTDMTLGIVPAGTSNDLARSLGLPLSPRGAVGLISGGRVALIDVGEAGGYAFGHAAIVGINSEFARLTNRYRRMVGAAAYPLALAQVYRRRRPFHAELTADGNVHRFTAYQVGFMNSSVVGGPLEIDVTDVSVTDRKLGVVIVEEMRPGTSIRGIPQVLSRQRMPKLQGIERLSIRDAELRTDQPMPLTIDGEILSETPVRVRVLPAALRVYVPKDFGAERETPATRN